VRRFVEGYVLRQDTLSQKIYDSFAKLTDHDDSYSCTAYSPALKSRDSSQELRVKID